MAQRLLVGTVDVVSIVACWVVVLVLGGGMLFCIGMAVRDFGVAVAPLVARAWKRLSAADCSLRLFPCV